MKHSIGYTCLALVVAGALIASLALANDKATQKLDPKMEELMKKAEAACTPGAAHQALGPLVGDWNAEVKMWMEPEAPPTITKGTAKSTWALKGRFVQQCRAKQFQSPEAKGQFLRQAEVSEPFH